MNIFENRILSTILLPLSLIYGMIVKARNLCYDAGFFSIKKIDRGKVISVGNIAVGGTGKTPVVKFLATYLQSMGLKVAILSRGYKRQSKGMVLVSDGTNLSADVQQAGDEPYFLAKTLPGVIIAVEADRYSAGQYLSRHFKPDVILLDDAYQHRRIFRDLNIVLVDASRGLGNGHLLPAGFLREPVSSLKRAHLIWFTRADQSNFLKPLEEKFRQIHPCPQITSSFAPVHLIHFSSQKKYTPTYLANKKVVLFSGIANNSSFEKLILNLGAQIFYHWKFPDHHFYSPQQIAEIEVQRKKLKAEMVITTEKDGYRLTNLKAVSENFYYLTIEVKIATGENYLSETLATLFNSHFRID